MRLGFVSAILPDLTLDEVLAFAADEGFACVELMCWPPGGADRRYAGVTHLDVTGLTDDRADRVRELAQARGVQISGLGYYPNPLDPDPTARAVVVEHLKRVIRAAPKLGVDVVNTFIGRDPAKSIDDNWPALREVWPGILAEARAAGVKIGIENCPMLFSNDEWPGGKNLAVSPAVWRRLFAEFPDGTLGLNFDPSHLIFQHVDYVRAIREFSKHFVHVHAKDTRIDADRIYDVGSAGLGWHTPKLPGLGDVDWGRFFSALSDARYAGAVCVEVEDRAYEGSLADRERSLRQSRKYLEQFIG
ncbi:MAG TPA: sugar phosphate isomerase/epimerase [Gemmataceae bacterium]|jgi:sugar phosphate isomerase/epimerase|nr:sugar phosphate isomerase/epimerase [Gemmataceae bacterium]